MQGEGSAEERLEGLALTVSGTLRRPDMLRTIFSMRLGFSSSEEPAPLQSQPTSERMLMQKFSWLPLTSRNAQEAVLKEDVSSLSAHLHALLGLCASSLPACWEGLG